MMIYRPGVSGIVPGAVQGIYNPFHTASGVAGCSGCSGLAGETTQLNNQTVPQVVTPQLGFMDGVKLWTDPIRAFKLLGSLGSMFNTDPYAALGLVTPLAVVGVVLLGAAGGGGYYYGRRRRNPNPTRRRSWRRRNRAASARRFRRGRR